LEAEQPTFINIYNWVSSAFSKSIFLGLCWKLFSCSTWVLHLSFVHSCIMLLDPGYAV